MISGGVLAALFGLAVASFAAATPLPVTPEPLFIGLLFSDLALPVITIAVASVANTAGSMLTFLMARAAGNAGGGRWIKDRWRHWLEAWYARWGLWALLLSWIPGGDLLVVLAGFARANVVVVLMILAVAKTLRFTALALLTLGLFG